MSESNRKWLCGKDDYLQLKEKVNIMIINKEGKLFGKISIIDIIVILLLAVLAFGIYTRFSTPQGTRIVNKEEQIEYTIEIKNVPSGTVYAFKERAQEKLTNSTTKQALGEIVSCSSQKSKDTYTFANGEVKEFDSPHNFDVTLTVRVEGKIGDSAYYTADNFPLHIGTQLSVETKYVTASGTITSIKTVDE